jgi:Ca-activated chloride channel family protein
VAARIPTSRLVLLALATLLPAAAGRADEPAPPSAVPPTTPATSGRQPLRADHAEWLESATALLSEDEKVSFAKLDKDYQRDQFIRRFWEVRDPFPQTARNEFRDSWDLRVAEAKEKYGNFTEDRARILLTLGAPAKVWIPVCHGTLRATEIWLYDGAEKVRGAFTMVFYSPSGSRKGPYRLWRPIDGLAPLLADFSVSPTDRERLGRKVIEGCSEGSDVLGGLAQSADWERLQQKFELLPKPNSEWLAGFEARSTELPSGAALLPGALETRFPARYQSRTVVEALLTVPRAEVTTTPGKTPTYAFLVDGEVLLKGELFENFRYRFDLPAAAVEGEQIPLAVQRYLRPGAYTLIVKLEDLTSHRYYRNELPLEVPTVAASASVTAGPSGGPPIASAVNPAAGVPRVVGGMGGMGGTGGVGGVGTGSEEPAIKLFAPSPELLSGRVRIEALTGGPGIARVEFWLNGRQVLSKSRAPWSVELDLGRALRTHRVRVRAVDAQGRLLASDEIAVNGGPHRFRVRFLEPERGQRYDRSVRASLDVTTPAGETLDRLELFLNEDRVATLYQPPFVLTVPLPAGADVTYLRAVAYLADGGSAEDLVFVNAPDVAEEIRVSLVELYTSVVDRRGRPQTDLGQADFAIAEDGVAQEIRRFEKVDDVPIHAGVVLDVSASMEQELDDSVKAALRFFESVIEPKDRAAVFTFSDQPTLVVPFTNDFGVLAGGLTKLEADGETALWDAIATGLHYFTGVRGKRALIVLTDGDDTKSRYSFDDVLDFSRRAGVAIYPIALGLPPKAADVRMRLRRFAEETGGELTEIQHAAELGKVYERIERELRSQYLLVYGSPEGGDKYREVTVTIARPGLEAKTIRGYYP